MWMNAKFFLVCALMANASTHKAPSFASALQEWLLTSVEGRALVGLLFMSLMCIFDTSWNFIFLCEIHANYVSVVDLRTEHCYLTHDDDRCGTPISGKHRVDACCCSVGVGWGPECDECPEKGTPEYAQLCPRGPGFSHKGDFINGRPMLKGAALFVDYIDFMGLPINDLTYVCLSALNFRHKWMQDDKQPVL